MTKNPLPNRAPVRAIVFTVCCVLTGCVQIPRLSAPPMVEQELIEPDWSPPDREVQPEQIASTELHRGLIAKPAPFRWESIGNSVGGLKIQAITAGTGGYRTLIVGSLAGFDPAAIKLTEDLARHIHKNSIILGGIEATIIRNPNPDGADSGTMENARGQYLNRHFSSEASDTARPMEVTLLLEQLEQRLPQRVIHIRTCDEQRGFVAASQGAEDVARDCADWLKFDFVRLPGRAARGTMERYLTSKKSCEIITIAFPDQSTSEKNWDAYSDALLNLLLDEDFQTRKMARQKRSQSAQRDDSR